MPTLNASQLRAQLAEKFPGLRMRLDAPGSAEYQFHPTGLAPVDERLRGGLPKGALTEVIAGAGNPGSSILIHGLLREAAEANEIVAFIDGNDSLEVSQLDGKILSRLLWIRRRSALEAVKAADLVLRDGNLRLVLIDLKLNPESQLRGIPATTWHRFQRLAGETGAVCVVFTGRRLLAAARVRITLGSQFTLAGLEGESEEWLRALKLEISDPRQHAEMESSRITS